MMFDLGWWLHLLLGAAIGALAADAYRHRWTPSIWRRLRRRYYEWREVRFMRAIGRQGADPSPEDLDRINDDVYERRVR